MPICASCGRENPDDAKFCLECGDALVSPLPSREQRKTVTVLFCDLVGSTALGESTDPEALRALLARYFEQMREIVERHGGSVEKFIGDAVMAVFGVPQVHEDDALRALRAASEMRDALPGLGLQGRIGITTGEVVTGTEERLATGDAVNVAARLEQAAQPGEILIGAETLRLTRDAAEVETLNPLELKGKADPVPAYRLLAVQATPQRSHQARFLGRQRELVLVREAWERALAEQRCELVTIVGDAGLGKSRLVEEALATIDVPCVQGRCLPYGEGITYWPAVEVLKQLDTLPSDPTAAESLRSVLRENELVTSAEEIAWAFRKLLEQVAPLVCVFDDIQWAEETFLDLIEHVSLLSSGAPILLVCMARPELLDRRPGWPATLRIEPLAAGDVDELMAERVPAELRARIARVAGGNPLFVGEMLAMAEETDGEVTIPPTLRALLSARLDQLDEHERRVLQRGSIEGEAFHRGAVQALTPEEAQVTPRLAALVRRELLRPDTPMIAGEDGFRFRHLLIRDAAYAALPKSARAELHERFAAWLQEHGGGLVELDEILGYHLDQAAGYRAELGMPNEDLAARARARLTVAGRRALSREDHEAALHLLERALALMPREEIDLALEWDRMAAFFYCGRPQEGLAAATALELRARDAGDEIAERCARLEQGIHRQLIEPEAGVTDMLEAEADRALPVFEAAGNDFALHIAYFAKGEAANYVCRYARARTASEQALVHARRAGLAHFETWVLGDQAFYALLGTSPPEPVLAWLDEQGTLGARLPSLRGTRAFALAMLGRFDEARRLLSDLCRELADRGAVGSLATATMRAVEVELLSGDAATAAEIGEEVCRRFEKAGQWAILSTAACQLAQALYALGRLDEAEAWTVRGAELGASDDLMTQILWRQVQAKVLARRGEHSEAERLGREAVAIADETDALNGRANAYLDLAEVLELAGKAHEAEVALEEALSLSKRKGNVVIVERTRTRLESVRAPEQPT